MRKALEVHQGHHRLKTQKCLPKQGGAHILTALLIPVAFFFLLSLLAFSFPFYFSFYRGQHVEALV